MQKDFFEDNFSDVDTGSSNDTPWPFINHNSEKEKKEWLNKDIKDKINRARSRLQRIREIESLYKGINYKPASDRWGSKGVLGSGVVMKPKDAKVFVNFVNEMVEAKVSQRSRFKPAIAVLPNNDEISDINNAQSCKQVLDCKAQEMDFEKIFSDGDKVQFLRGESYTWVTWDKSIGGIHPEFQELVDAGKKIPGKTDPMRGDLRVKVLGPDRSFPQLNKNDWEEVCDISMVEWVHVDELKALYPDKEDKIFANDEVYYWDEKDMTKRNMKNHCMVVHYFYKVDRFMPKGSYVKFINSCILEEEDLTKCYKHGKLPVIFDTDIDLEGELHGRPFTDNITRLQALHNMVMASAAKGFAIASNPKWVAPQGSVSINKLTNEYGLMEFKGATPPQLVTYNGINQQSWEFADKAEGYIQKQSSVYGISRGEPPKGVKAAVALQFLDEQELQRESRGMAKRQRRILDVYRLCLSTMSQYYRPEDGRIFRMLGQDNSYLVKTFNMSGVSNYDIRLQNSSSLPDSKAGKIAAIVDINMATANDPFFGREEIAAMMDMGNDQKFRDKISVSIRAADTIVQRILNGELDLEPNEWDDFIVQYPIFLRSLQERQFKDTEVNVAVELAAYIETMEYLMLEKIKLSPAFAQRMQSFYMFPVFYKVPIPVVPDEVVQGKSSMDGIKNTNQAILAEGQQQEEVV